jgi:hypothetical protein
VIKKVYNLHASIFCIWKFPMTIFWLCAAHVLLAQWFTNTQTKNDFDFLPFSSIDYRRTEYPSSRIQ